MRRRLSVAADDEAGPLGDGRVQLVGAVVPAMRGLAQPRDVVERLVGDVVDHGVDEHEPAPGARHAQQLGERGHRLGQQMEGVATHDQAEGVRVVGQRVEIDEAESDVDQTQLAGQPLPLLQHVGKLVGGLDRAHVGSHGEAGYPGARGVVEDGVVRRGPRQLDEKIERSVAHLFHGVSLRRRRLLAPVTPVSRR